MRGKRDTNHKQIVTELRECGFSVLDLGDVGDGVPDLLVSRGGWTALVECKTRRGNKLPSELLTADQRTFHAGWRGRIIIAFESGDVVSAFN